ncbi:MAG: helix-turn-helix transcriptional regulator [Clostridia bacterium]|nr:helix-turn-helix transcriptional regulator [Clostridia bacterium]
MDYKKRLYDLRIDNDLRQEDVANFLKITKQAYGMYENGKRNLPIEHLVRLSDYYNVSTDFILNLTNIPQRNEEEKE